MNPNAGQASENARTSARPARYFRIVTFYETADDAIRALRNLDRIAAKFSNEEPIQTTSWSFRLLETPEANAKIIEDVSAVDMLVVAASGHHSPSERIVSWIKICLLSKTGANPTLLALHEDSADDSVTQTPLWSSLSAIAEEMDATYLCSRDLR